MVITDYVHRELNTHCLPILQYLLIVKFPPNFPPYPKGEMQITFALRWIENLKWLRSVSPL